MNDKPKDPKPPKKPAPQTQRSYGPPQGRPGSGGGGKAQKSAAHRLGKSRKVH